MALYLTQEAPGGYRRLTASRGILTRSAGCCSARTGTRAALLAIRCPWRTRLKRGEQYHRFLITPEAMFKAESRHDKSGSTCSGVYHTHPDEEARPSLYDRDHAAWTAWSYIIVSVKAARR